MNKKFHLFLCITALSLLPLWAGDAPKPLNIEQRLREIDLSLALKQYERLATELSETRLNIMLLDADVELTEAERKKQTDSLQKRCDVLMSHSENLRARLLLMAKELGEQAAVAKAK